MGERMIKRFYITILGLLIATAVFSQSSYNLEFKNFKMVKSLSNPVHETKVELGETYHVVGTIKNHGPDDFSQQSLDFNVNIDYTENTSNVDFEVKGIVIQDIASGNTVSDYYFFDIKVTEEYFDLDTTNIVIIWPSNVNDTDPGDDESAMYMLVVDEEDSQTGIAETTPSVSFRFYPNPAGSVVNVMMNSSMNGVLTLTDVTGKRLYEANINTSAKVITIPLTIGGDDLANGMYFLNFTSSEGREVQKLLLNR